MKNELLLEEQITKTQRFLRSTHPTRWAIVSEEGLIAVGTKREIKEFTNIQSDTRKGLKPNKEHRVIQIKR